MPAIIGFWLGLLIGPVVLIFLGFILYRLISELLHLSAAEEAPAFESNWGGMGRGLGGWSVNRMMVISLVTLLVLIMFGSVAYKLIPDVPASTPAAATPSSERQASKLPANAAAAAEGKTEGTPNSIAQ